MNEEYYISLIYKKIEGLLSDKERTELSQWLELSEENKETSRIIEKVWDTSGIKTPIPIEVNVDDEFRILEERIKQDSSKTRSLAPPSNSRNTTIWRIAASLLILVGVGGLMWSISQKDRGQNWEEIVTADTIKSINLSDGSIVKINKNSRFQYPKDFKYGVRRVKLLGEAFFDIQKADGQSFVVETSFAEVSVLGTKFSIATDEESLFTNVYVQEGKVRLKPDLSDESIDLTPGDQGSWSQSNLQLKKVSNSTINQISWATGLLKFDDIAISKVIQEIGKHHNIVIRNNLDKEVRECPITLTLNNVSIESALETMSTIISAEWKKISNDGYQISGGTCQ